MIEASNSNSNGQPSKRQSSEIQKCTRDGQSVYLKHYVEDDWGGDAKVIRRRASRERELIEQISSCGGFGRRLGVVEIADFNAEDAMIATREIPGQSLDQWMHSSEFRRQDLMPWFLAGRWLRVFQRLHTDDSAHDVFASLDQGTLVEYCERRLDSMRDFGSQWPDGKTKMRLLEKLQSYDTEADHRVWVHADYAPGNLMWGNGILTPIDFAMARLGSPLDDASYLIHRLEMALVYRPWLRIPVNEYRSAILRGLGNRDAHLSTAYRSLRIKHYICRLHTYLRRPAKTAKQAVHDRWVRYVLRRRLKKMAWKEEKEDTHP